MSHQSHNFAFVVWFSRHNQPTGPAQVLFENDLSSLVWGNSYQYI